MKGFKRAAGFAVTLVLLLSCTLSAYAAGEALVPMGRAVGIRLETEGVTVVGFSEVQTAQGTVSPASDAGLKSGDVITAVGDRRTDTAAEFLTALSSLGAGEEVSLTAKRGGREMLFRVMPAQGEGGTLQLGLWLRDGVNGIGTVTYYDPESGSYGALGHGINDPETGTLLPFAGGSITQTNVVDVVKGAPGAPGELCGQPDDSCVLGSLERNTGCGIFGKGSFENCGETVPVAEREEVKLGPASILTTVDGGATEEYSIEISRIYRQPEDHRFLLLTVTDARLLARTGGIVQGMSGSPIMQDGKIVGAVTHVLLNDATRGYGISIRDMLDAAG